MTNYEAICRMTQEQMEQFLEQVYLAGLNNGMYAARNEDDDILVKNPFENSWLTNHAEPAIEYGFDEDGEPLMSYALVEAIFRNAGISTSEL